MAGAASRGAPDALSLLRADHQAAQEMFQDYAALCADEEQDSTAKQDLADRICAELSVHAQIEEEIFYPALRQFLEEEVLLDEAEVEHASTRELIAQLQEMEVGDDLFDAKVTVLGEYINHHIDEEQGELFIEAKSAKVDLQDLGQQLRARRRELRADRGLDDEDESDDDEKEMDGDEGPGERKSVRRAAWPSGNGRDA
jgi:hemerythrin-like domain-containing protein